MALDFRSDRRPVRRETIYKYHALRVAYIENGHLLRTASKREQETNMVLVKDRLAHIHLEVEVTAIPFDQPQIFGAGASRDHNIAVDSARIN
jgi:hypothetical protein